MEKLIYFRNSTQIVKLKKKEKKKKINKFNAHGLK